MSGSRYFGCCGLQCGVLWFWLVCAMLDLESLQAKSAALGLFACWAPCALGVLVPFELALGCIQYKEPLDKYSPQVGVPTWHQGYTWLSQSYASLSQTLAPKLKAHNCIDACTGPSMSWHDSASFAQSKAHESMVFQDWTGRNQEPAHNPDLNPANHLCAELLGRQLYLKPPRLQCLTSQLLLWVNGRVAP